MYIMLIWTSIESINTPVINPKFLTCLWTLQGKLEPRLIGATTATRVGEGADCRFLGGSAGGGLLRDKKQNRVSGTAHAFVAKAKSIQIMRQARKKKVSSDMYAHTNKCMNTWTHTSTSPLLNSEMKVRVFHVSLSPLWQWTVLLVKFSLWVNTRSKWGWEEEHKVPWYGGQPIRHCTGQSHTLMHWTAFWLDDHFFRECRERHSLWDNATMQVINTFIQSSGFMGGVWGGMLQWRQVVCLWANILLLLRGSPLASVSTQLCSVPRIQKGNQRWNNWETAERVRQKKKTEQQTSHSAVCSKPKARKGSKIVKERLDGRIWSWMTLCTPQIFKMNL